MLKNLLFSLIQWILSRWLGRAGEGVKDAQKQAENEIRKQRHETDIKNRPAGSFDDIVDSLPE